MTTLVAVDIGGTHARFALATVGPDGISHAASVTLATGDHDGLPQAMAAFAATIGQPLPRRAAIAIAAPLGGDVVRMTNNRWTFAPATLAGDLGVDQLTLVNDFAAIAHAVTAAGPDDFAHVAGPDIPLPPQGAISLVGPGTGLGVACVHRQQGRVLVQATEGGHIGFAPSNPFEDALLARLRALHGRVSAERVCAGPGIAAIYAEVCAHAKAPTTHSTVRAIWDAALAETDPLAIAARQHFCAMLGAVAGDVALAHGAGAVVLAGGLGARLSPFLANSGFATAFCAKGRYIDLMAALPVRRITLPEPGLFGAAAAFFQQYGDQ